MRRELVVLAIAGLFGFGTAMSTLAAPGRFPNIPSWIWYWLFWGGLALVLLMVLDCAWLWFWQPHTDMAKISRHRRMVNLRARVPRWSLQKVPPGC